MPTAVPQNLLDRRNTLQAKLAALQKGEVSATAHEGDGRQDETIARTKKFLRQINVEIAKHETPGTPKPTGASGSGDGSASNEKQPKKK